MSTFESVLLSFECAHKHTWIDEPGCYPRLRNGPRPVACVLGGGDCVCCVLCVLCCVYVCVCRVCIGSMLHTWMLCVCRVCIGSALCGSFLASSITHLFKNKHPNTGVDEMFQNLGIVTIRSNDGFQGVYVCTKLSSSIIDLSCVN